MKKLRVKEIRENVFRIVEMEERFRNRKHGGRKCFKSCEAACAVVFSARVPDFVGSEGGCVLYLCGSDETQDGRDLLVSPEFRSEFVRAVRDLGGYLEFCNGIVTPPEGSVEDLESPVDLAIIETETKIGKLTVQKDKLIEEVRLLGIELKATKAARTSWLRVMNAPPKGK